MNRLLQSCLLSVSLALSLPLANAQEAPTPSRVCIKEAFSALPKTGWSAAYSGGNARAQAAAAPAIKTADGTDGLWLHRSEATGPANVTYYYTADVIAAQALPDGSRANAISGHVTLRPDFDGSGMVGIILLAKEPVYAGSEGIFIGMRPGSGGSRGSVGGLGIYRNPGNHVEPGTRLSFTPWVASGSSVIEKGQTYRLDFIVTETTTEAQLWQLDAEGKASSDAPFAQTQVNHRNPLELSGYFGLRGAFASAPSGALFRDLEVRIQSVTAAAETSADTRKTGVHYTSYATLLNSRASLQDGSAPQLQPALDKLIEEAETALQLPLQSVLDKTYIAKSGDKQDYLSIGRYSWPNPNTPDELPWVTRDGQVGPGVSDATDFLRFSKVNRAAETLALAYFFTGDNRYAEHAARLIRHWYLEPSTRMNPHFIYAQIVPGIRDENLMGYGVIEANSLSMLMDAIGLLQGSEAWSQNDQQRMIEWMEQLYGWLMESPHARAAFNQKHNIGTWADGLAAHVALFLGREDEARRILTEVTSTRIDRQIKPDGSQPNEQRRRTSFNYYLYNIHALLKCAILAEQIDLNLFDYQGSDGGSIRQAVTFVAPYIDPEKPWVKEDIGTIRRTPLISLLALYLTYRDNPAFRELFLTYGNDLQLNDRWRLLYNPAASIPKNQSTD